MWLEAINKGCHRNPLIKPRQMIYLLFGEVQSQGWLKGQRSSQTPSDHGLFLWGKFAYKSRWELTAIKVNPSSTFFLNMIRSDWRRILMTRKDSYDIIWDVTESRKCKNKVSRHVRLEWGVSHAKFQLSIGNGSGAIARKPSGGTPSAMRVKIQVKIVIH